MARPKRKQIKFTEESVNALAQEIYNDSHNIKAKITRLFSKWETKVKDGGEIQALGESITKLIVAEAKVYDQKLVLLRYLKEIVFAKGSGVETEDIKTKVSSEDRNKLIKEVAMQVNKS